MRILFHGVPSPATERALRGLERLGCKIERLSRAAIDGLSVLDADAGSGITLLLGEMDDIPSVLRHIRMMDVHLPIIVVQGNTSDTTIKTLLDAGSDDVVGRECDSEEILARIRAVSRRVAGRSAGDMKIGALNVPLDGRPVTVAGQPVKLSSREQQILGIIAMQHPKRAAKAAIYDAVYAFSGNAPHMKVIDSHIHNLRQKLSAADPDGRDHILTNIGLGYNICEN